MDNLMIVKQIPVIEQNLKALSEEIDKKVQTAVNLVCTEDTVKDVKNVRASLNKQFKELEEGRKDIKKAVIGPYEAFEKVYKECVGDKFKNADSVLKAKIDEVEAALKTEKESKIRAYFEEKKNAENVMFLDFAQANINVTLPASEKSLKEAVDSFIKGVKGDVLSIETQKDSVEIFIEYKKTLNLSQAMLIVAERKKAILDAQMEALRENREESSQEEPAPIPLQAPEEIIEASFTVSGTRTQLKALREYLKKEGIKYE